MANLVALSNIAKHFIECNDCKFYLEDQLRYLRRALKEGTENGRSSFARVIHLKQGIKYYKALLNSRICRS
jgi:hypothetical protein